MGALAALKVAELVVGKEKMNKIYDRVFHTANKVIDFTKTSTKPKF